MNACSYVHRLCGPLTSNPWRKRFGCSAIRPACGSSTSSASGELCVGDLARAVGISESAVSHQLRLLRTLRLVRVRREGRQAYYAVDDHHILELLNQARTHVEEGS